MNSDFVKSSTLTKQGNVRKNWKRRLFRLDRNGQLGYYKDPFKPALGAIDVKGECIGLLRHNQCHCQWPLNVPKSNCFGIMTPIRVYHVYADSSDDVEDWISVLRNASDVLRRQSSSTYEHGDLYQNLQPYPSAPENEEVESDPDEILYEDVVKDAEDDPLYTALPATFSSATPQNDSQLYPPLPSRVNRSSAHQLANEVFQMADELDEVLADCDEMVYESIPADQDISVEQLKAPVVENSVVAADGVEDGDFYAEVATELQKDEIYDDVASSNDGRVPPLVSESLVEELYDDVTMPAVVPQLLPFAAKEVAALAEAENNIDHSISVKSDNEKEVENEIYDSVTDDRQNIDEELYDDITTAAAASRGRPISDQDNELRRQQQQEQFVQEDIYDDVMEVNEGAKQFRDRQIQHVEQVNVMADRHAESEIFSEVTSTSLSSDIQSVTYQEPESTETVIKTASLEQQSFGGSREQSVLKTVTVKEETVEITESLSSVGQLSLPMVDIQTEVIEQVQEVQNLATTVAQDAVPHVSSSDATESKGETKAVQPPTGSSIRFRASAQNAGKILKQSKKDLSKPNYDVTEKKRSNEFTRTVTAVQKGAITWSKSGSRQKEKDAKLRQSRIVEEQAERQIAEWQALHSKLIRKRDQLTTSDETSVVKANENDGISSRSNKTKGTNQSETLPSNASKGKPLPPKKPANIAEVVLQHQMRSFHQEYTSSTDRQQEFDRKPQQSREEVRHAVTVKANERTSAPKQEVLTHTQSDKSIAFKAEVSSTKPHSSLPVKPLLPPRPSLSGMSAAINLAAEHSRHVQEWERKRQEVFAAEKARQERRGAEEKRRHEERTKQNKQEQLLEAEKVRQARERSAWTRVVQSKHCDQPSTRNTTLMHTSATGKKDKSEEACQPEQVVENKTAKAAQSVSTGFHGSKDGPNKEQNEASLLRGAETTLAKKTSDASVVTRSKDLFMKSTLTAPVFQAGLQASSDISETAQRYSSNRDHQSSLSTPLKEKKVLNVIQQFEAKKAFSVLQAPVRIMPPQLRNEQQGGSVTVAIKNPDRLEDSNLKHSRRTVLTTAVPDKVLVDSSVETSTESHQDLTPVASTPTPQINNITGQVKGNGAQPTGKADPNGKAQGEMARGGQNTDVVSNSSTGELAKQKEPFVGGSEEGAFVAVTDSLDSEHGRGNLLSLMKPTANSSDMGDRTVSSDNIVFDKVKPTASKSSESSGHGHSSIARLSAMVSDHDSSNSSSSEKNQDNVENSQHRVVRDQKTDKSEDSSGYQKQETSSDEAQKTLGYEPRFTEVQIREKKSIARRKAAALSWPMEGPPSDPYGPDGNKLRDEDPLMVRKLSVVARGVNAMAKALAAAKWIDKEIRKLIAEIQSWGSLSTSGKYQVTFGILFEECSPVFEALSGTLKTAKKHGVVQFTGELLLQGVHDSVVVTLLKTSIPDSNADTYTYQQFRACSISVHKRKGKGFSKTTQQTNQSKCFLCGKTVYPMEYVSGNDHPMHKNCFKCCDCGKKLSSSNYAVFQDKFFCINHYEQRFKQQGGYGGFQ
ncbi:uncharacterized protein LOC134183941 isoform X2 [Corticium candelabrum]|nr:uncharacterized protein LOC134183941 isoform X2 [Corticium candelabrum]